MMKIAFWGYGKYGRRMFESLTSFCNDEFEIVRVYDRAFRKLKNTAGEKALPIHDPEDLLQDYKKGLFEKVFVCMLYVSEETKQFLRKHSIPELCLGGPDDLFPLSAFEQGKKPFEIEREGYDFYVIKNLYGAMANYESVEMLYLFDNEGRVVKEHRDHFDPEYFELYNYPFVFRHSKAEKVFLEGQYCVLTKKHSSNYWHYTYCNLEVVWLLEKAGFQGKYVVPDTEFGSVLLRLLDVPSERIISLKTFEQNKIYVFEEVFYVLSVKPFGEDLVYGSADVLEAVEHIKNKLTGDSSLPKILYVKRIGKRKLLGADKLLDEYGFTAMIPEDYSVLEQMTLFYNADIVFCVHGANSTNCLYMRKGTVFVEAFSSYWMNRCNIYALSAEGVHYLPVSTLETVRENKDGVFRDFTFPEILLRSALQNAFIIYEAQHQELG
jgi:hypothetical protein